MKRIPSSLYSERMGQLSRELLFPLAPLWENQEFKVDPLRGGLTAPLNFIHYKFQGMQNDKF